MNMLVKPSKVKVTLQCNAAACVADLKIIRPKGLIKIGAIDPAVKYFAPVVRTYDLSDPEQARRAKVFINHQNNELQRNVYWEIGVPKANSNPMRKSNESDIDKVVDCHIDLDPVGNESAADAQKRIGKLLASGKTPPPTYTYVSGNGVFAAWRYSKAVSIDSPEALALVKARNAGVRDALGGKKTDGADNTISTDHLFRVPQSVNYPDAAKIAKGRKVVLAGKVTFTSHRYSPADLPIGKVDVKPVASDIGDAASVDLEELTISDRSRAIIETGEADGKRPADESTSGWRMVLIHSLIKDGLDHETILGVLMHPDNAVATEKRSSAAGKAKLYRSEIAKVAAMRAASASDEFDDDMPDIPDDNEAEAADDIDFDKPPKAELEFDLSPYQPVDPTQIPTRKWLYGTSYIRKFIGLTAATGGAGKSSLILVECVAMACGRDLLGIEPAEKLRVLYWNGEDPLEELERRVAGILQHYDLTKKDLGDRLFIKSGRDMPIRIAELDQGKARIAKPMTRAMVRAIRDHKLDVVAIDPFVSSHSVPENDNNAIDLVAKKWADIADKTDCAIILSHHTRKTNGVGASIEDSRGASSLNYAARTRRAINTMTATEAESAGFDAKGRDRLSYFKADMMGSSMIKPTAALDWYRFVSVDLMNGPPDDITGEPTEGDSVGVVVKWDFKKLALELDANSARDAVDALATDGPWRYDVKADRWAGVAIAKSAGVDVTDPKVKAQIAALIDEWIKDGTLDKYKDMDPVQRRQKIFVRPMADDDEDIDFG